MSLLEASNISKIYAGKVSTQALTNINLTIAEGEFVGIMGPSGSGKTTLLNMVSTIDTPTSGSVKIRGQNPYNLNRNELAKFRRRELGFVFQEFNLLDTLTVAENIVLPLTLDSVKLNLMNDRLYRIAEQLGIRDILNSRTYEISGGQRQRTAIARAVIVNPSILLADEPTGALDSNASRIVMESLGILNAQNRTTIMLVTHDPQAACYCQRIVFIKDGKIANEIERSESRQAFFHQILDSLSLLGGSTDEFPSIRLQ